MTTSRSTLHIVVLAAAASTAFSLPAHAAKESTSQYMENAAQRCAPLPEGYKQACLERVQGAGTRAGSVEGGGILRSSETTATLGTQLNLPADASNRSAAAAPAAKAAPKKASKKAHNKAKAAKPAASGAASH